MTGFGYEETPRATLYRVRKEFQSPSEKRGGEMAKGMEIYRKSTMKPGVAFPVPFKAKMYMPKASLSP